MTGSLKGGSSENVLPVNELETSPHLFQVATKHNRAFKFSYSLESQTGLWHFFISQVKGIKSWEDGEVKGRKTFYKSIILEG